MKNILLRLSVVFWFMYGFSCVLFIPLAWVISGKKGVEFFYNILERWMNKIITT